MTALIFAPDNDGARPIVLVSKEDCGSWIDGLTAEEQAWATSVGFKGGAGEVLLFPGEGGEVVKAAGGLGGREGPDARAVSCGKPASKAAGRGLAV